MRQVVYSLRFTGRSVPSGPGGTDCKVSATAPSCATSTIVGPSGVIGTVEEVPGEEARFDSDVVFTENATFLEVGTVTFGSSGDCLRFSTVGSGYLGPCVDPSLRHGTVMRRIDGGEGRFASASGLITSNFIVDGDGAVTDYHLGIVTTA